MTTKNYEISLVLYLVVILFFITRPCSLKLLKFSIFMIMTVQRSHTDEICIRESLSLLPISIFKCQKEILIINIMR